MRTTRLEFFSDGVFAIVITLLVIEIRLPERWVGALGPTLAGLWPSYLAYAISFIVIGAIWINHHGMFLHIDKTDNGFLLLNVLQLMVIAFIPFPTAVLAQSIAARSGMTVATTFYGAALVAVGISVNLMWRYAVRNDLLKKNLPDEKVKLLTRRFLMGPASYLVATLAALIVPWAALAIFVGINVYFLWPRWKKKRSPTRTPPSHR
jgi:uncharacterized membrane protein